MNDSYIFSTTAYFVAQFMEVLPRKCIRFHYSSFTPQYVVEIDGFDVRNAIKVSFDCNNEHEVYKCINILNSRYRELTANNFDQFEEFANELQSRFMRTTKNN